MKRCDFCSFTFTKTLSNKYGKILLDASTKAVSNAETIVSKKVVYKTAEASEEQIGKIFSENILDLKTLSNKNLRKS